MMEENEIITVKGKTTMEVVIDRVLSIGNKEIKIYKSVNSDSYRNNIEKLDVFGGECNDSISNNR